jgi:Bacterial SH3 domain.
MGLSSEDTEAVGFRITSPNLRKTLVVWAWLLLAASWSLGQQAQIIHNVNLRGDPSTDNPPIRLLTPPEVVTLIEPNKTSGYYHVQTDQGEKGWVWSHNVQVIATTSTPTPTQATATPTPEVAAVTAAPTPIPGPATAVDPIWLKGTPAEITFSPPRSSFPPFQDRRDGWVTEA